MDMEREEGIFKWKAASTGTWKVGMPEVRLMEEVKDRS